MNATGLRLGKLSLGVGDRFGQQAEAQLGACILAQERGAQIVPVWNKSNREHLLIGSEPGSVRASAQRAVNRLGWKGEWHVDADHIQLRTVDRFISAADFFTIDVADSIGKAPTGALLKKFVMQHPELTGRLEIPGIEVGARSGTEDLERIVGKYLVATQEAGSIYRHVLRAKGNEQFITEVSIDETDRPQGPLDLVVILAALADEGVPVQTIAPRFTGRFNKGVDYVGDLRRFEKEFDDDLYVIQWAIRRYKLPDNLKLSIHSGSDKFSLYPVMRRVARKHQAGLHLKTAGTTWLEEVAGLAEAGGEALRFMKDLYSAALARIGELCAPYAAVVDIDRSQLPSAAAVNEWTPTQYVLALRHDPTGDEFNRHFRQLLHVAFRIASERLEQYLELVQANRTIIARHVTANLFHRHIEPLFLSH